MQWLEKLLQTSPVVMGILNLTPDSFSDGSKYFEPEKALQQALRLQKDGAHILDVGAESTRPGALPVSASEQIARLSHFFEVIFPQLSIPVSIDARDASVAAFAVQRGAKLINDVSGLRWQTDPMLALLKEHPDTAYILMHSRGTPQEMLDLCHYKDLVTELKQELLAQIALLEKNGIGKNRVVLDMGVGFAKKGKQNLHLIACLKQFADLGHPLLLGVSRKSFLKEYFEGADPRDIALGTELSNFLALQGGASILRVHDVAAARRTIRFFEDTRY